MLLNTSIQNETSRDDEPEGVDDHRQLFLLGAGTADRGVRPMSGISVILDFRKSYPDAVVVIVYSPLLDGYETRSETSKTRLCFARYGNVTHETTDPYNQLCLSISQ